jgi:hypothetical protein
MKGILHASKPPDCSLMCLEGTFIEVSGVHSTGSICEVGLVLAVFAAAQSMEGPSHCDRQVPWLCIPFRIVCAGLERVIKQCYGFC